MVARRDEGPIGPLTIPTLLHDFCLHKETGALQLRDESISKCLYFSQGQVVFATSTDPGDRLGPLFLRSGMISLRALQEASQASRSEQKRLGAALVQRKAIRPQDLVWGVTEQVRGMVLSLFDWTRGEYRFDRGPLPSEEVITLKVQTPDLVMAGIKSIQSWPRIEAAIGGLDTQFQTSPQLADLAGSMDLSLDEWTLLSRAESGATLGQMCDDSALPDFEVCRLIWGFMVVGLLSRQDAALTAQSSGLS